MVKDIKIIKINQSNTILAKNVVKGPRLRARSMNERTPETNDKKRKLDLTPLVTNSGKYTPKSKKTPKDSTNNSVSTAKLRMSEKRRSLFKENDFSLFTNKKESNCLKGIEPLSPSSGSQLKNKFSKQGFQKNNNNSAENSKSENATPTTRHRQSLGQKFENIAAQSKKSTFVENMFEKTNRNSVKRRKHRQREVVVYSSDEDYDKYPKKKTLSKMKVSNFASKIEKLECLNSPELQISTKSFYSHNNDSQNNSFESNLTNKSGSLNISPDVLKMVPQLSNYSRKIKKSKPKSFSNTVSLANKGVGHGIRKHYNKNKPSIQSIDDFLKTIKCEKLKSLPSKRISAEQVKEVHNIFKTNSNPIEMARPLVIDFEKDVSSRFSDSDENEDNETEENHISNIENQAQLSNLKTYSVFSPTRENIAPIENNISPTKVKKFFKSGHSSAKEVKITDNIKLGVSCGKMSLLSEKKKKKNQSKTFLNEQAVVNDIIKNLTISPEKNNNTTEIIENVPVFSPSKDVISKQSIEAVCETLDESFKSNSVQSNLFEEFRERLPYNTSDPNEIERQNLLLDFLITNNICTEENFEIFISDPDNHKDEADEIINNMIEVVNDEQYRVAEDISLDPHDHFRNQIPYNTNDPIKAKEQTILLDFLIENNICTEENFTIFIKELETRKDEAERIIESVSNIMEDEVIPTEQNVLNRNEDVPQMEINKPSSNETKNLYPIFYSGKRYMPIEKHFSRERKSKIWRSAIGQNQYQIDAGQKEFGAKQCPQCGLVYTVHEPEEEIIHKEYHESMFFLKFRGWIDEDVIERYFEWSNDGRIIRIRSSDHSKKKERLIELLKIVDKELGFSSYILPEVYVAFLAVRKNQFVGLCLVQFLNKANRYVKIDGVDCCTEDYFEAKIGISRIWVSPLCRRMGIASKLILAAKSHSMIEDVVDFDKIAFSAPTEDGKEFAQKVCRRTDFLVYQ